MKNFEFIKSIDIENELGLIQSNISQKDVEIFSSFGKKVTRYKDLYEKYWHLTEDYSCMQQFRPCDFYSAHTDKNNILNAGVSVCVMDNLKKIHAKILSQVQAHAQTMYPAYVVSYLENSRKRLPIHTHNTHQFIAKNRENLLSLSFALKMTDDDLESDQTRLRFYPPLSGQIMRLEEETRQHVDQFQIELKPKNFSFYGFDTEASPHTAIFGKNLYCWFVFDYAYFKFDFDYDSHARSQQVLAIDVF